MIHCPFVITIVENIKKFVSQPYGRVRTYESANVYLKFFSGGKGTRTEYEVRSILVRNLSETSYVYR